MILLFASTLVAAALKWIGTLSERQTLTEWSMFCLLIFIGVATASTSTYVGQNLRSLRHQYAAQQRRLKGWFEIYSSVIECAQVGSAIDAHQKTLAVDAVVAFERLMIDELMDWIAVTEDDAMELGPT
jgi:hypothetical protein